MFAKLVTVMSEDKLLRLVFESNSRITEVTLTRSTAAVLARDLRLKLDAIPGQTSSRHEG